MRRMRHTKAREWQGCDIAYDFSNPASLYDATSGGALVASGAAIARAEDQSGNAAHMTQATAGNRPLRVVAAQNGRDAARFDGTDDYLTAGDVADLLAAPLEMMWLGKRTNSASIIGYFGKSRTGGAPGKWVFCPSRRIMRRSMRQSVAVPQRLRQRGQQRQSASPQALRDCPALQRLRLAQTAVHLVLPRQTTIRRSTRQTRFSSAFIKIRAATRIRQVVS